MNYSLFILWKYISKTPLSFSKKERNKCLKSVSVKWKKLPYSKSFHACYCNNDLLSAPEMWHTTGSMGTRPEVWSPSEDQDKLYKPLHYIEVPWYLLQYFGMFLSSNIERCSRGISSNILLSYNSLWANSVINLRNKINQKSCSFFVSSPFRYRLPFLLCCRCYCQNQENITTKEYYCNYAIMRSFQSVIFRGVWRTQNYEFQWLTAKPCNFYAYRYIRRISIRVAYVLSLEEIRIFNLNLLKYFTASFQFVFHHWWKSDINMLLKYVYNKTVQKTSQTKQQKEKKSSS